VSGEAAEATLAAVAVNNELKGYRSTVTGYEEEVAGYRSAFENMGKRFTNLIDVIKRHKLITYAGGTAIAGIAIGGVLLSTLFGGNGSQGPEGPIGQTGQPGNDAQEYSLTDQDKEDIAGLVPVAPGPNLDSYAKKSDIPGPAATPTPTDLSGYVTVDNALTIEDVQAAVDETLANQPTPTPAPAPTATPTPPPTYELPAEYTMAYGDIHEIARSDLTGFSDSLNLPSPLIDTWTNDDVTGDLELTQLVVNQGEGTVIAERVQGNRLWTNQVPGTNVAKSLTDYLQGTLTTEKLQALITE